MAIGKACTADEVDQSAVVIRFGDQEVYPSAVDEAGLQRLAGYMAGDEVRIHVSLHTGNAEATVWGCDLTEGYVRINADYTT
jgi:glutamate N-acetyltransferase/amino-acid N-acetyltransferase